MAELEKPRRKEADRFRLRVLVLILTAQSFMILWAVDGEIARGISLLCYSLMMPTVLFLLIARLLRRWLPFTDRELMLAYVVLTATIPIVGYGGMRFIVEGVGYLSFFADRQPTWEKFLPYLSRLPVLHDEKAIDGFYRGEAEVPWGAWTGPIAFWSAYLLLLGGIWISMAAILRRIWVHHERLTFPVAMLPLQLSDPRDDIFRRPIFWLGFAGPAILQSLLALHEWIPAVPAHHLKATNIVPMYFTTPPWNALPDFHVGYYPMALGLAYFVPSDATFSCWFLAVAMRLSCVVARIFGVEAAGTSAVRFPYREEQAAGAWIAFALIIIWGARSGWKTIAASVPLSERRAVKIFVVAAAGCTVLCALMMIAAGIPVFAALIVVLIYAAYVIAGARVRAEAGAQWTFSPVVWTPHRVMTSILGTHGLSRRALVAGGHFNLIHVDIRAQSLPYLMEGMAIADRTGIRWRTLLIWVGIGSVTALIIGWWASLEKIYALGAATAKAEQYPLRKVNISFAEVDRLFQSKGDWDPPGVIAMSCAMGFTVLLAWLRRLGIPAFHPVGYVAANTRIMDAFIVPFFIAWLTKVLILRFFGHSTYRRSLAFFVGIILGDIITQAVWTLIGWIFDVPIYQFLT